ncbi:flagellar basal body-associated FliL family protein [Novosphingobium sp. fls2-241-R2A-195]|uniref:flagellar basal body-associated FliL family protein n=1 Tax=Novosphingobium sp. fls2-241-R2A-195 TaxID=3040296 RepID=UPI00254D1131|nr:flagellar basal body-associated FliL family protein [Novosphingobium sp. fls2-241-R2A-195]
MSDEKTDDTPVDEAGAKKKGGKVRLIAIAVVAVGMLAGAGGVYWYMQKGGSEHAEEKQAEAAPEEGSEGGEGHGAADADPSASYIEVAPMMVNLRGGGAQAKFVKLRFVVVAAEGKTDAVKARLPVILDALQPFLRELRPDDLNGSAAVFRIKEEMIRRSTEALGKGMVRDILIQDLIQQ